MDEPLTVRPSSTGGAGDDSGVSSMGGDNKLRSLLSTEENSNKILKDLLNQKDEDDLQGTVPGGERILTRFPSHHDYKPSTTSSPTINSSGNNNMLKEVSIDLYVKIKIMRYGKDHSHSYGYDI